MAKISDSFITSRDIVCLGEIKIEFVRLDPSGSGVGSGDHLASNLQNPKAAYAHINNNLALQGSAEVDSTLESGRGVKLYGVGVNPTSVVIIGY